MTIPSSLADARSSTPRPRVDRLTKARQSASPNESKLFSGVLMGLGEGASKFISGEPWAVQPTGASPSYSSLSVGPDVWSVVSTVCVEGI